MRKRVEALVASLTFVFSVAAATHAATFRSEESSTPKPATAAVESPRQLTASHTGASKSSGEALKKTPDARPVFTATDGHNFSVSTGILMTADTRKLAQKLAAIYYRLTGRKLHFTSGYRTPGRQALAMYEMIKARGPKRYRRVYRRRPRAAEQILNAYLKSHDDRARAIGSMTLTIKSQVENGIYISNHMREQAFDVRATAKRSALESAVGKLGGRVDFEFNHYHVEL